MWMDGPTLPCPEWVSTSHRGRVVPSGSGTSVYGFPEPVTHRRAGKEGPSGSACREERRPGITPVHWVRWGSDTG